MTDQSTPPKSLEEMVEKLWQGVLDVVESLVTPPRRPVPVPIRKR